MHFNYAHRHFSSQNDDQQESQRRYSDNWWIGQEKWDIVGETKLQARGTMLCLSGLIRLMSSK